jgi:hypothetical protein
MAHQYEIDESLVVDRDYPLSPWMTVAEAAAYLQVTEWAVHNYARKELEKKQADPNYVPKLTKHNIAGYKSVRLKRAEVEALVQPVEE